MNYDPELNKAEGTLSSQSIMSLLSIIIFAIGVSFIVGLLLFLYTKIIDLNVNVTFEELLDNQATIPDFFSNVISYSICRLVLASISIPVVFFLAIRDRFKGSYMNLVDLKKYKMILVVYVIVYTLIFGGIYYAYYNRAVDKYIQYNSLFQEYKADEKGYFNDGVKRIEILPNLVLGVIPIGGVVAVYVALATAESTNKKYLERLIQNNNYLYQSDDMVGMMDPVYVNQDDVNYNNDVYNQQNNYDSTEETKEEPPSNIFY